MLDVTKTLTFLKSALIVSVVLLVLVAVEDRTDGYYTLMRLVVCGTAGVSAWVCWKKGLQSWTWGMIVLAALFNPLIPVRWDRDEWTAVGVISATAFGGLAWAFWGGKK